MQLVLDDILLYINSVQWRTFIFCCNVCVILSSDIRLETAVFPIVWILSRFLRKIFYIYKFYFFLFTVTAKCKCFIIFS
jgi:hypothetical protein